MVKRLAPFKTSLERLGLNLATISYHAELLHTALRDAEKPTFPIIDTCRLDNGGILPATKPAQHSTEWAKGFVAFIPAAGAASRYSQPLYALSEALEHGDTKAATAGLVALAAEGAASWPLPTLLAELIAQPAALERLSSAQLAELGERLHLPKALMPCVREGVSFLAMKHLEHSQMPGLDGQIFITPPAMQQVFATHLAQELSKSHADADKIPSHYLEQGPALSTIRFKRDGLPFLEPNGEVSPVPAGHGSLAQLFPAAKAAFPAADALFIRNIDNIMGTSAEVLEATEHFLSLHRLLLTAVQGMRSHLAQGRLSAAVSVAAELGEQLGWSQAKLDAATADASLPAGPERVLWQIQAVLFHARLDEPCTAARLQALFARPVNLMGQVPNTQHDVGGTPCFIAMPDSDLEMKRATSRRGKVCLEVPHATPEDKRDKLANPALASHFNPGFCAVEITADPAYYSKQNHHFWLMAEKTYRGMPVVYYETVLYELIGHSDFANTVFVEVPRRVFNPHKTLRDALDRTLASWIPG